MYICNQGEPYICHVGEATAYELNRLIPDGWTISTVRIFLFSHQRGHRCNDTSPWSRVRMHHIISLFPCTRTTPNHQRLASSTWQWTWIWHGACTQCSKMTSSHLGQLVDTYMYYIYRGTGTKVLYMCFVMQCSSIYQYFMRVMPMLCHYNTFAFTVSSKINIMVRETATQYSRV